MHGVNDAPYFTCVPYLHIFVKYWPYVLATHFLLHTFAVTLEIKSRILLANAGFDLSDIRKNELRAAWKNILMAVK